VRTYYYVCRSPSDAAEWAIRRESRTLLCVSDHSLAVMAAGELAQGEWAQYGRPTAVRLETDDGWREDAQFGREPRPLDSARKPILPAAGAVRELLANGGKR
jgi:hypothetical protein